MRTLDDVLKPFIRKIPQAIKPNHLAVLRVILIAPVVFSLIYGYWSLAALLFCIASALDILDGALARARNQVTALGAALDPIADKALFVTTFALLGFAFLPANLYLAIIMVEGVTLLGGFVTSSAWHILYKKIPRVDANRYGKYKSVCYFLATLLLFAAPWSLAAFILSVCIYYVGLLLAIMSMVAFNLTLAKKN